ncbi:Protein BZZ1, variant 3 [Basidiobolus ranarum]|uniref:Protein BZZ1, variant 3 n=1 Tax=Basidiobolus ranarum TaxID=34480 RepID=A0ABR2X1H2_9FUNG
MDFGSSLRGAQLGTVNQFLQNGIQLLNEFREFIKDRAQIERDHASKLESLTRKYQGKFDKRGYSMMPEMMNGEAPPGGADSSAVYKALTVILTETENIAKLRQEFADSLMSSVADPLRTLAQKKEDSRRKQMQFSQRLMSERDRFFHEKDKAKENYDESFSEVQTTRAKQERAQDEKSVEKLNRQYNQDFTDRNNNKNLYLIAVNVANAEKSKYHQEDFPALLNNMQWVNESRITALKGIWKDYVDLESSMLTETQTHLDDIMEEVENLDEKLDSQMFIKQNAVDKEEPSAFVFEPCSLDTEGVELVTDDASVVFLNNKLVKNKSRLGELTNELNVKSKELEGLHNLQDAYTNNRTLGDPDDVQEKINETLQHVSILNSMKLALETEQQVIISSIGENSIDGQRHNFKTASFTIPTTCDYCQTTIWGLAKQGFTCKECGYNCHAKCELKVSPDCSKDSTKTSRSFFSGSVSSIAGIRRSNSRKPLPQSFKSSPLTNESSMAVNSPQTTSNPYADNSTVASIDSTSNSNASNATVLYDYDATDSSQVSVSAGAWITILEGDDGSGWVKANYNGQEGLVPAAYVQYVESIEEPMTVTSPTISSTPQNVTPANNSIQVQGTKVNNLPDKYFDISPNLSCLYFFCLKPCMITMLERLRS